LKQKILTVVLLVVPLAGCSYTAPDPGHESVLVRKPWVFGHGGVDPKPVTTGLQFIALSTHPIDVSMQPIQFEEKFTDLMTSDGVPLQFDSVIRVQVTDPVVLVKNFGPRWYENNLEREFANRVRQAVRKHGMNETAISTTAIDSINAEVDVGLRAYIKNIGLPVRLLDVIVGKANPPDAIKDQRIATATQEQRRQTEIETKMAEDARYAAEKSRAAADNAYRESMGLSPEQFVQLQAIQAQREICGQDKAPCTFIVGGAVPTIQTGR
jgi:regulator of protease activity HflC (stomatin/prohibitin superfamily)